MEPHPSASASCKTRAQVVKQQSAVRRNVGALARQSGGTLASQVPWANILASQKASIFEQQIGTRRIRDKKQKKGIPQDGLAPQK